MEKLRLPDLRIVPYRLYPAEFNMAADEFLLAGDKPQLRFYGWQKPTLSFGRSNFSPVGLNPRIVDDRTVGKVKRLSGGKTVLHQYELTYSFSCDSSLFPSSILETYRLLSQPLAAAFEKYGLSPRMERMERRKSESSICFREVSSYELVVGKKKIVGSAQYRRRKRFLQHGSILLKIDWDLWKTTWCIPCGSDRLERHITSFHDELGLLPEAEEVAETVKREYLSFFSAGGTVEDFSATELATIRGLEKKYIWNGFV